MTSISCAVFPSHGKISLEREHWHNRQMQEERERDVFLSVGNGDERTIINSLNNGWNVSVLFLISRASMESLLLGSVLVKCFGVIPY
uniref:Uncharacterized protein LOC104249531 n=1 Tax=Nicotiana sylvestris TaxID=4096 RepID=A0A1U7YMD1_NICSY|nr:PREDICTED: uncharacterized protein LOC104249531 [Nicotiana sylvestris]